MREYIKERITDKFNLHIGNVELTQGQYDALVSLAYNAGEGYIIDSKHGLSRALKRGDMADARARFLKYSYANGKWVKGLQNRRNYEVKEYWDK